MLLEEVKRYCLKEYKTDKTRGILLVGSAVYKSEFNDIDILILQDDQDQPIKNIEIPFKSTILDIWIHRTEYFQTTIGMTAKDLNEVENISLYLSLLSNVVIWYENGLNINHYINKTKNWEWEREYRQFLDFKLQKPTSQWAKQAMKEDLHLLSIIKRNLKTGKPISHRRKDYSELIVSAKEDQVRQAFNIVVELFRELKISREWTEWKDTKKFILKDDWNRALSSIKDVLRFITRFIIKNPPKQILDPNIWYLAEKQINKGKLHKVLSLVFN